MSTIFLHLLGLCFVMGRMLFSTVDIQGIDILGIDILGVDILGMDILAPTPTKDGLSGQFFVFLCIFEFNFFVFVVAMCGLVQDVSAKYGYYSY